MGHGERTLSAFFGGLVSMAAVAVNIVAISASEYFTGTDDYMVVFGLMPAIVCWVFIPFIFVSMLRRNLKERERMARFKEKLDSLSVA